MKFDLHCHTKEGSLDSKVPVETYARRFAILGYDGFMIADHNSYRGCLAWDRMMKKPENREEFKDLTVIRGMEYDTKDAGHILIIMPDGVYLPIFRIRGMRVRRLIPLVHTFGGICGPAHPFGVKTSSMMGFKNANPELLSEMDFVEVFNTCEQPLANQLARELAEKYGLPGIGGSDAHTFRYIGMAYTEIPHRITCNNDLIHALKFHNDTEAGGIERVPTKKGKAKEHWVGLTAFHLYNHGLGKMKSPRRAIHHYRLRKDKNILTDDTGSDRP